MYDVNRFHTTFGCLVRLRYDHKFKTVRETNWSENGAVQFRSGKIRHGFEWKLKCCHLLGDAQS